MVSPLIAALPVQSLGVFTPPDCCHGMGFASAKMGGQGRTEAGTDLTGPGAGSEPGGWKLSQALCRKRSCPFKALLAHRPQFVHGYDLWH